MNKTRILGAALSIALLCGAAAAAEVAKGYLAPDALDTITILPPAPQPGSYRYDSDRSVFRDTRKLVGSPRWQLATADVDVAVPAMLRNFSCAVGGALSPESAPRTTALLTRLQSDTRAAVAAPKDLYQRRRPFLIDPGATCQPAEKLRDSFDYPSGHTTWGWAIALVLTEAAPQQASAILTRGRAYGESRVVCGAHNASAIEAGRTTASTVVAALHGVPEFRDDVAAARSEIAALRSGSSELDDAQCAAEAGLIRTSPY
jgi:acid phosphatase (class A)